MGLERGKIDIKEYDRDLIEDILMSQEQKKQDEVIAVKNKIKSKEKHVYESELWKKMTEMEELYKVLVQRIDDLEYENRELKRKIAIIESKNGDGWCNK